MHNYSEYEICDAHCHIFPEKIAEKAAMAIGDFYDMKMKYPGSSELLLKSGSQINVKKYLVCSTATVAKQTSAINDFIIDECKKHSEYIGFGTLHPDTENMDDEINKIIDNGLRGIKLHPDFQRFNIDDKKAYEIYDKIQGKLPVLIHMGDDRYEFSRPYRLAKVMQDFKDLEVFAAHFGGYCCWEEAVECLTNFENIYFDTSSTMGFVGAKYSKKLIANFDFDKLMFGSDYPMWDHKEELNRFFELGLSDEDNKKILSVNFKRYFNI